MYAVTQPDTTMTYSDVLTTAMSFGAGSHNDAVATVAYVVTMGCPQYASAVPPARKGR
jgi:hypothetical protein